MPASDRSAAGLWAVTAYYNPAGYRRRLANYRTFRRYLGLPLVTVDLAFGEPFELRRDAADVVVQVRDGDVMWLLGCRGSVAWTAQLNSEFPHRVTS